MKVLNIGRDKDLKLFEEGSAVQTRMIEYGKNMEELHITVFVLKKKGFKNVSIAPNVFIHPTNSFSKWLFVWDAINLGKKIIIENKFIRGDSVITCQDPFECGFVGWRIAKKFDLPLHLQIHTDFLSGYFITSFLQWFRVQIAKFLLPKAKFVRVVSKRIYNSVTKSGIKLQNDMRILPIRVPVESLEKKQAVDFKKMFPQFNFIILMASRLTLEKRIVDALHVFSRIVKSYPYVGLIIAGEGPLRASLKNEVKSLHLSKNVVFLGWRDDVFSLMKSANMFLSTSEYEGYGMSIIEAGIANCPVLSTNVGLADDFLVHKKNSYICPVGDRICLYDGIIDLLGDNGLRYSIAQNLALNITSIIPSKEEYINQYVGLLTESS